jgi:hypothetical protein
MYTFCNDYIVLVDNLFTHSNMSWYTNSLKLPNGNQKTQIEMGQTIVLIFIN